MLVTTSIEIPFIKETIEFLQKNHFLGPYDGKVVSIRVVVEDSIDSKDHISELDISVGLYNLLYSIRLYSIKKLLTYSADDLLKFRGMGPKRLENLVYALQQKGFELKSN
jgi:DNA-directed RNA polymerase alpha subunit